MRLFPSELKVNTPAGKLIVLISYSVIIACQRPPRIFAFPEFSGGVVFSPFFRLAAGVLSIGGPITGPIQVVRGGPALFAATLPDKIIAQGSYPIALDLEAVSITEAYTVSLFLALKFLHSPKVLYFIPAQASIHDYVMVYAHGLSTIFAGYT